MGRKLDPAWDYFERKDEKGVGNDHHNHEARCKACLARRVAQIHSEEVTLSSNGGPSARNPKAIELEILGPVDPTNPTQKDEPERIVGKVEELLDHLKACTNVSPAIKVWAEVRIANRAVAFKDGRKEVIPPRPTSAVPGSVPLQRTRTPLQPLNGTAMQQQSPATPSQTPLQSFSSVSTITDSPSTTEAADGHCPSKYQKLDDARIVDLDTGIVYVACTGDGNRWSQERVDLFHRHLCRLMIVCNIAWWAVENPYWRWFFAEWLPGAPMPGRSELSGPILDREAEGCVNEMRGIVGGKYATGQCDGWKSIVRSSIVAMMFNVEYTPWLTNTADISRQPKTARSLLTIVLDELRYATEHLKMIVVAWCTDCGGDAAKMRRLLVQKFKWMVSLDCWAHQINLIVGDMLKAADFVSVAADALTLVKWFNNHSLALGMLRATTMTKLGKELSLILPCLTRWTTHYLCVRRLLQLKRVFKQLILDKEEQVLECAGKGREARDTARKMIALIQNEQFWDKIEWLERHLEPLARAANATQSDCARLDVVLITLANLYHYFSRTEGLDAAAASAVRASLEKRWKKAEQDIFLLALILNPYIRLTCFAADSPLRTPGHIRRMADAAFLRFFAVAPSESFRAQLLEYLRWSGNWTAAAMDLKNLKQRAKLAGAEVNLIHIWREWSPVVNGDSGNMPTDGAAQLALLAMRILSMVPNSASVERVFSMFGIIQTKLRNRLGQEKVRKTVQVKTDTVRKFGAAGCGSRKRKFGEDEDDDFETGGGDPAPADASDGPSDVMHDNAPHSAGPSGPDAQVGGEGNDDVRRDAQEFTAMAREMMDEAGEEEEQDAAPTPTAAVIDPDALLLKNLFDYPRGTDTSTKAYKVLTHYWATGERNLDAELLYQEDQYGSTSRST